MESLDITPGGWLDIPMNNNKHLRRIAANLTLLSTLVVGTVVIDNMATDEHRAIVAAAVEAEREAMDAEYANAKAETVKAERDLFAKNGCTKDARLSPRVLLRVKADNAFAPYGLSMVTFDEGFKAAKAGAWVVGFCN